MLWAGGLALQALFLLVPLLLARHLMANSGDMLRAQAEHEARWRVGEVADSLSRAKQREDSRASGNYTVTAAGDTMYALVSVPSGRPDSAVVAALGERTRHQARYISIFLFGFIPVSLTVVTLAWLLLRRSGGEQPRALGVS
jgi:hypothetical protein